MKLPNYQKAIVAQPKIVDYLLNVSSENGKAKARFFLAFGFTIDEWEIMAQALQQHARVHEVVSIEARPPFGVHYVVEGALMTPDECNPALRCGSYGLLMKGMIPPID